jgi:galactokinase
MSERSFRAPGRVNLMGDHTDYNEGFVLPMAIDRECVVTVRPTDGARIRARSQAQPPVDVAADGTDEPRAVRPQWGRYVAGVTRALARRGRRAAAADLDVASSVPIGSGLSSSAALEVALALALCDVAAFDLPRRELALACQEAEHTATAVPSGIMDQLTSVLGIANAALLIDCRSLAAEPVPLPAAAAVVAVHSGVSRTLETTAFGERRAACQAAARRLGLRALRDATPEQVRDDPLARHVVSENGRVLATAAALRAGDVETAGRLFSESHASLRDDYRVSTPELDRLVEELECAGAYGARLTGAGFGGAVVALCAPGRTGEVAARATDRYARATGREPIAIRCEAVEGAGPL